MELLLALFAVAFPGELSADETIPMDRGVEYAGARAPATAAAGETISMEFYFTVDEKLPSDVSNFLHVESPAGSQCRVVHDRKPTGYRDGALVHEVELTLPSNSRCVGTTLRVYTGFYDTDTGRRYRVEGITVPDNRIPAASIELRGSGAATSSQLTAFPPSDIEWRQFFQRTRPWWGWIGGLFVVLAVAFALRRYTTAPGEAEQAGVLLDRTDPVSSASWRVRMGTVGLAVPAILGILAALNFVKDDAYISFRYAHNLVTGEGLVFNPGEYVEGFTNFLWIFVLAPFEAAGFDLFQVVEIIGPAMIVALLVVMVRINDVLMDGPRRALARFWAPLFVATSSSVALWTTSGMEQPLAMLLPVVGAYLLWTCWDDPTATRRAALSGVVVGLGCLTRPEIHLIGILLGLPMLWRMARDRSLDPIALYWGAGLIGITAPAHAFRLWYFGSLLPNTFYVKTGGSTVVLLEGLQQLRELLWFNGVGFAALLMPFAFVDRRHVREKLVMLGVAVGFMAYMVWVGDDEMTWYRLYLPALPFMALMSGLGLRNLCAAAAGALDWEGWKRFGVYLVAWLLVGGGAVGNFLNTYYAKGGFNGRGALSGSYHPDIGKFLTRHARPGALVAFQDMGSTPYHAPDLKFLDFIGLVDQTVAHARHEYGLHAFVSTGTPEARAKYNAEMRDYFHSRSPEWVILTSYIPGSRAGRISNEFSRRPVPATLEPYIANNKYQFGIYNQKFKKRYRHVRTWPRSATYYLSLFRRRDLWNRTPGEVVIGRDGNWEVGPAEMPGIEAIFEGGLEMLGSRLQRRTTEGHHFFVTTWWNVPGAMPEDLNFFLHLEGETSRTPYDHRPGDWMYPANRWESGQIVEDRTLFQIPPDLPAGTYEVYMGAYYRSKGERLQLTDGPGDGEDRVRLGTVTIEPWTPLWDHIIKPTDVDRQRKYPDRIVDHGAQR